MGDQKVDLTVLLQRIGGGDREAQSLLMDAVYVELSRIASRILRAERPGHSLEPRALISEVWLRTIRDTSIDWQSRSHFYRAAAHTMRNVLVDHARSRNAKRRPNASLRVELTDVVVYSEDRADEILEVHEALERLVAENREAGEVVELRYFGGYTLDEIAKMLGISVTTVKKKHEFGMASLQAVFNGAPPD